MCEQVASYLLICTTSKLVVETLLQMNLQEKISELHLVADFVRQTLNNSQKISIIKPQRGNKEYVALTNPIIVYVVDAKYVSSILKRLLVVVRARKHFEEHSTQHSSYQEKRKLTT